MTDQSKYARAIEAIRTKDYFGPEVKEACGWGVQEIDNVPFKGLNIILDLAATLPGWLLSFGDNETGPWASATRESVPGTAFTEQSDFIQDHDPSPEKSLLIVMLMALEEMDKRGEA